MSLFVAMQQHTAPDWKRGGVCVLGHENIKVISVTNNNQRSSKSVQLKLSQARA
jgi:hypothetical protein